MELSLQGRDLSRGMSGGDVAALHQTLIDLGYSIADKELTDKFFGDTTRDNVVDFQKQVKLPPNGVVDAKIAWLMGNNNEHPNKFIVVGHVNQANGTPLDGAIVKAFDKDLRSEQQLGTTDTTKRGGIYEIMYRADEFGRAEKDRADLMVRVFDNQGTQLAASGIIFNATKVEIVDLTIGDARGLSEFERMVADLTPLLEGLPHVELTPSDIAFLNGETQIDATLLNLLVESAHRHNEANTIPQSAFYGLFRQGLPTVLTELLQNEIALLRASLELSSNHGIIAQLSAVELDQIANQLRILKAALLLEPGGAGATSSLGDLLRTSELTTEKQEIVASLYVEHGGTTDAFWEAINQRSDFTDAEKTDVRFTLQVGALTTNHIPLVVDLRTTAPSGLIVPIQKGAVSTTALSEDATALRPFVSKDVTEWKTTLEKVQPNGEPIGAPPTIPGNTLQEKIANYAVALNAYMEKVLPTPMIAARFEDDTESDSPFNPVRADLQTFFRNNPLFEFKKTPIDAYLSEGREEKLAGVVDQVALIAELKNMQRLFNIAPRYAEMRTLRKDDVHSALSMVKLGERRFTEKYAAILGGTDKASEAYREAKKRHATALNFYLNYALASNLPSPSVVGNGTMKAPAKTLAAASATPDLPTLFGSLDLCDCSQCQSLYSPAAYFVDILRFLGDGPIKNNLTPLEVLFNRRPDLEHIELTCENTATQLPYVDLTREILERAVQAREFDIAEGDDIDTVIADLNAEKVPTGFPDVFRDKGYSLTANASVRKDEFIEGQPRAWLILDSGWAFRLQYLGTGAGFKAEAWPQTSWTADELRANPEHVHDNAYAQLRTAVYPWDLPLNQPVEETRVYLNHFGVQRQQVMETFFRDDSSTVLTYEPIANEYLGLTKQEADIITGNASSNAWDFWGLKETGNEIEDPAEATGAWDIVLKRVSLFLQQSGLSYRDMLELLGSYFINPAAGSGRTLAIVSIDSANPATCNLSKLEIEIVDTQIPDENKRDVLIATWNRMHRFVRLWRKLGWTMRDLDKAVVALQPKNDAGTLDITAGFLVQLSHIQRLRVQLDLPVVNLLSFWAPIDAGRYFDQFAESAPPVPSLYAQLFNNKSAAGQSLEEDPADLSGDLAPKASTIAAALQVTIDDLNLLMSDPNVVSTDDLTLANLSALYRHATFAKALKYSIRNYLSALKLISATPFATTEDTVKFTQHTEKILASGFSIEDLNYLLRHDFSATSNLANTDDAITVVLSSIRDEVRKITAENSFVAASTDVRAATNDPNGDLTKRKLSLLNWDTSLIEQLVAVLNGTFTHQADLAALPPGVTFPESLKTRVSYDTVAMQLRFTGVMTSAEQTELLAESDDADYQNAVNALFNAPRAMVTRHMGRFSVPTFATTLDSFPSTVVIPSALKSKIYYDAVAKELKFVGIMTDAERKVLLANEPKDPATGQPTSPYGQAVDTLFNAPNDPSNAPAAADVFLTSSGATNDVSALFDDAATTPPARFIIVLRKLLPYLRTTLSERIVIQLLGDYLQLDAKAANDLLTTWANSPANPSQKAISEFLAPAFAGSNANVEVSRDAFPDQFQTFLLLYKIAGLSLKFRLTAAQMRWLFEFGPENGWLDLNTLPLSTIDAAHALYQGWARLADVFELRDALPLGETLLSDIFTSARDTSTQLDDLLDKLSKGSGWKLENLTALSGDNGFKLDVDAYKDEVALRRLRAAFTQLNQLGASADQSLSWTLSDMTEDDEVKSAQDIKSLVRAKLDDAQWLEIAKTLNDPLREKQRAALVSYLMQARGVRNANELYDDFLIDVEMSPCMMTTRIKQAIASVQLFIQRSLMNLESDVALTPREAREWAQWRKQYRIWEANRKVLLYPENWIEPELRDGKSPFFKDLENELLQADVTMDTAETAFLHYLEKLQEVARLEVVGMYREQEFANTTVTKDVLHVIGRTFSDPHTYYYRKQIDSASWTPWEKVEADIQGDHLIPVIWNRRLYVFWPVFSIKQQERPITLPMPGGTVPPVDKTIEVQLAWTEYMNGKWSAKKLSTPFLSKLKHGDMPIGEAEFKLFSFKSRVQTTPAREQQLFIDCYGPLETTTTSSSSTTSTNIMQEKFLFSLGAEGTKLIVATVNGNAFQASDVNKVEVVERNSLTGEQVSRMRLSSSGRLDLTNNQSSAMKYYLAAADYRAENVVLTGQKQFCWFEGGDTLPPLVGGNGDAPATEVVGVDAGVKPKISMVDAAPEPTLLPINTGTKVCEIISQAQCEFNLVTIPTTTTTTTVTNSSVAPMQAIASFHFDDGQQSVAPLLGSNAITSLDPIVGTRFENMMMVEYENPNDGLGESRILQTTPGTFRLLGMHQSYTPKALVTPMFFQDDARSYFVTDITGTTKIRFSTFFHPTVRSFFRSLNRSGINGLLTLPNQLVIDEQPAFDVYQADATRVDLNMKPREDVDFTYGGAYSLYNWELFFHAPFMIATQLSKNQRFDEAQKWFHYIFDPTATDSPEQSGDPGAERFWRVKPLYREALQGTQTLEELFADSATLQAQVREWQANPFKPHVIARLRLVTYMKAVVMRYLDNLIAWGDQLFRRDTIETINEATQLYILAAQILGRRPEQIPARAKTQVQTFRTLDDQGAFNSLANAAVEIESFLPTSTEPVPDGDSEEGGGVPLMPFFGIPGNEKLLGYWTTVADRLFKIRHCQNIEGIVRSLPTFEPPIDPGLLVKAAGMGVDVASALSDINVALPHYRFSVMLQKASELCGEVKSLGGALLSALEKRDAEALSLLRSTHELKVLKAVRTVKEKQLAEAVEARAGLERSKELTTLRRDYYRNIRFMNQWESNQLSLLESSLELQTVEMQTFALASFLHLIPNLKIGAPTSLGATYGGENIGNGLMSFGQSLSRIAGLMNSSASMAGIMGGHQRRFDDWKLQERMANKELEQIERQIAAADIRKAIAEKELSNHDLQVQNTTEVDEFMRSKFTNRELYDWMVGQISGIYFQSYQLAYDMAKRAERAYRYELGLRESSFIQFGYWDSLKKGLLAGERLSYDIKRMEVAYLDQNRREYEIVKHISLLSIDPISLVKLKQTGECFVTLPETLFDVDYAGHYMRRIKSVGITVPCVAGPYSGINCTLTLQSSTIRHANTLANGDKYGRQADDPRFVDSAGTVQSIVTSGAQNDSGMFETNLRDERYLPFEGQGAISTWRIEMPKSFKSFDYNTISDVVLHLRYTAREGGSQLRAQAEQELQTALNDFVRIEGERGLTQMFSMRHEFSTEWSRFLNAPQGTTQSLTMPITKERFPFLFQGKKITIDAMELFVKVKPDPEFDDHNKDTIRIALAAGTTAPEPPGGATLPLTDWNGLIRAAKVLGNDPGTFTLNAWLNATDHLNPNAIQDIVVVCRYTVSNPV